METTTEQTTEKTKAKAWTGIRKHFRAFFRALPPDKPFQGGRHIWPICNRLDEVVKKIERGENAYLIVSIPFRHAKSAMASWRFPAWALIRNPKWEIVSASYGERLAVRNCRRARTAFATAAPMYGLGISRDHDTKGDWETSKGGALRAFGLGGGITGHGADLLIIDDYYRKREQAESDVIREKVRDSFESDMMTRLAPHHGVVIVANRWHEDDLVAWIQKKNDPTNNEYDDKFPKFEVMEFPAYDEKRSHGNGASPWLWPERYDVTWYESMKAAMGSYSWNSQGLQQPKPRRGNMLRADMVQVHDPVEFDRLTKNMKFMCGWDLASSEKERTRDDPDYTVGVRAAVDDDGSIWIDHVTRGQWTALKREQKMVEFSLQFPGDPFRLEVVAGYKDAYVLLRSKLRGNTIVRAFHPTNNLFVNAGMLEPKFEAGLVHVKRNGWNRSWFDEIRSFPSGKHDDQVAGLVVAVYNELVSKGKMMMRR